MSPCRSGRSLSSEIPGERTWEKEPIIEQSQDGLETRFYIVLCPPFTFSSFVHTPHVQLYLSLHTLGSQSFIILKVLSVFSPWSVHHLPGLGIDKSCLVETGKRLEIHHRLLDLSSKSCFCLQGCGALFTLHVPIPGQNGDNDGDKKNGSSLHQVDEVPLPLCPHPGPQGNHQHRQEGLHHSEISLFTSIIPSHSLFSGIGSFAILCFMSSPSS